MIVAGIVAIAIVAAYRSSLHNNDALDLGKIDAMWRLLIGLGCVPACIALYFRLTIPESPRFTMDIERDIRRANAEVEAFLTERPSDVDSDEIVQRAVVTRASRRDFMQYFSQRENFKMLFACAWSWFALDVSISTKVYNTNRAHMKLFLVDRVLRTWIEFYNSSQSHRGRQPTAPM